jgi:hypothetical protein
MRGLPGVKAWEGGTRLATYVDDDASLLVKCSVYHTILNFYTVRMLHVATLP